MSRHLQKPRKQYPLDQCGLYKIRSRKKLAKILGIPLGTLEYLAAQENNYLILDRVDEKGKARTVECPKKLLLKAHVRIANLLRRVQSPDYCYAVPGKSSISNARAHILANPTFCLDIKSFFPSCTEVRIHRFFSFWLECSPDVSAILTKLCSCEGHVPTGSPLSQELAFWAYLDLFEEINRFVMSKGGIFTLYVDDITVTFPGANNKSLRKIARMVERAGLGWHKSKLYPAGAPKDITGVLVTTTGLRLPNRQHLKIKQELAQLHSSKTTYTQMKSVERLVGRYAYASTLNEGIECKREGATGRLRYLRDRLESNYDSVR